jgi:hypothetical protein
MNVLGNKERQIFGSPSARTMLQLIRTDLFGYDPHLEVYGDGGDHKRREALLVAASIERKALGHQEALVTVRAAQLDPCCDQDLPGRSAAAQRNPTESA